MPYVEIRVPLIIRGAKGKDTPLKDPLTYQSAGAVTPWDGPVCGHYLYHRHFSLTMIRRWAHVTLISIKVIPVVANFVVVRKRRQYRERGR